MTKQRIEQLGQTIRIKSSFDSGLSLITGALKDEGFGILTEIDVKKTMKEKLDLDYPPMRILGACNPHLANRALSISHEIGLLLPCNVTVEEIAENLIEISIIDPLMMLGVADDQRLAPVASEAKERLDRVALALKEEII